MASHATEQQNRGIIETLGRARPKIPPHPSQKSVAKLLKQMAHTRHASAEGSARSAQVHVGRETTPQVLLITMPGGERA